MKKILVVIFCGMCLGVSLAQADERPAGSRRELSETQIERVQTCQNILKEVDDRSLQQAIHELTRSRHPEENLQILEAMAKTYADVTKELDIREQTQKEGLYSTIKLNMAYLQLGGLHAGGGGGGNREPLYRLVRSKLRDYLPARLLKDEQFFYTLE